ncbi:hypothetical protein N8J89_12810 [Crossiella sp. CA-258035]|uniref:hypothetical protein n=1 Tax=Crossiella sp. CA-258035 TaxID=2981138 RepID=UPI0024BCBA8D|nr:hypothetical protein [Crossiella sp. CA-258035]WHT21901.1 hypothetical protein N8J89_12810 [Crossiella sp. CA-258035]
MPETTTTTTEIPHPRQLLNLAAAALEGLRDNIAYHPQVRRQASLYNDLAELVWHWSPEPGLVAEVVKLLVGHPHNWRVIFADDVDRRLALAESYLQLARTSALFNSRS